MRNSTFIIQNIKISAKKQCKKKGRAEKRKEKKTEITSIFERKRVKNGQQKNSKE